MKTKMRISFDFDGTLNDEIDGTPNHQKVEIQNLAKKYVSEGHYVCIITRRFDKQNSWAGIRNEHLDVMSLAQDLGITDVIFTNRGEKFPHILNLKIDMHFENWDYEIQLINQACKEKEHKCLVVPVEDPYWRDLVY